MRCDNPLCNSPYEKVSGPIDIEHFGIQKEIVAYLCKTCDHYLDVRGPNNYYDYITQQVELARKNGQDKVKIR